MRRLLAWAAAAAGGLAAYRFLTRRPQPVPGVPEPEADPRAADLRAKLDSTREPEPEQPSNTVLQGREDGEASGPTPEERRERVHERGRAAVDQMRRGE
jgi:hypothetical protein